MPVSPVIRNRVAGYKDEVARERYTLLVSRYTFGDTSEELQALADRLGVRLQWSRFYVDEGVWKEMNAEDR